MSIFTQPFFSLAGQKERSMNALNALASTVEKIILPIAKPVAKVLGKDVTPIYGGFSGPSKLLNTAANNPKTTALIGATAWSVGTGAAAGKAIVTGVTNLWKATPTTGKLLLGTGGFIAAPVIIANPEKTATAVIKAPSALGKFQTDVYTAAKDPSAASLWEVVSQNKAVSTGIALVGAYGLSKTGIGGASTTYFNTKAEKENTKTMKEAQINSDDLIKENKKAADKLIKSQEKAAADLQKSNEKALSDLNEANAKAAKDLQKQLSEQKAAAVVVTPSTTPLPAADISTTKKKKKKTTKKKKKKKTTKKKKKKKSLNTKKRKKKRK
jgi:hypothetical protein